MREIMRKCIDAGREGCPCGLTASGDCLICSKLNGKNCDDCSWQGACIHNLYQQNGQRPDKGRIAQEMPIDDVRVYSPDFQVFLIKADRGFCQRAARAGAYVFVRGQGDDLWYDTPISVLKSEPNKGLLHLAVCGGGPKSKGLLAQRNSLLVRGVYGNGLVGQASLVENPQNTFVFAKGVAIAPLRNYLDGGMRYGKYLKNLQLFVDVEKTGLDFLKDYFGDLPVESIQVCDFTAFDFSCMEAGPGDNVFALTSPYYVEQIASARVQRSGTDRRGGFVRPAEGNLCCGEGICGACTCVDPKGNTIRRCKVVR